METYFICHGSPLLVTDDSLPAWHFLKSWQQETCKTKPKAILIVSAHWETRDPTLTAADNYSTIHDFSGFPKPLYKIKYPAPGAPKLTKKVKELLTGAGIKNVKEDKIRGLDHGAWIPLMLMYPEADIPVCQLSVQTNLDASHHYNMGKALASLRDEGVLIIGSGSTTHNLRAIRLDNGPIFPWALEFDNWVKDALVNERHEELKNYLEKAPHAKMAHPRPEHLYPLYIALGAAGERAKAELIHHSWEDGSLSYASYRFTATTP